MSAVSVLDLHALAAQRWQAVDPLLPAPPPLQPGCGADLVVAGSNGHRAAAGSCAHHAVAPESLDLTWGAARRFQLDARAGALDDRAALDRLLSLWRDHLGGVSGADEDDSSAVVTWPSRDVGGVKTLLAHGLAPLAVIAARSTPAAGSPDPAAPPGVRIRRAEPDDVDEVVRLGLEVIRFDATVSGVTERPNTADALRRDLAVLLADAEPWVWIAEADGRAMGMVAAEPPEAARWIAPLVGPAPVAYLLLMGVSSGRRGRGVGAAMAAHLHREIAAADVAVTLLHYAQVNPLSAPFWSQQGYRPLWTVWEAQPARTLR